MNKITKVLSSHILFAVLLLVLAVAMGVATFIENDFGTQKAHELIYKAWWFEFLLVLMVVNILTTIVAKKMYRLQKLPVFLLHIAFVFMLLGAAVTRYFGYEGTMHIRENQESAEIVTKNKGLNILQTKENQCFIQSKFEDLGKINRTFAINNQEFKIKATNFYPNAYPLAVEDQERGITIVGFIAEYGNYRNFSYIGLGQTQAIDNFICTFNAKNTNANVNLFLQNDSVFILSHRFDIQFINRENEKINIPKNNIALLQKNGYYQIGDVKFTAKDIFVKGRITAKEITDNLRKVSAVAEFTVEHDSKKQNIQIWENIKGLHNMADFGSTKLNFSFGNEHIFLPFSIYLNKFEVTHYPGSNSPSSFSSYVTVKEKGKTDKPFHIYMNNVLKANGFRFFQSSYDPDEKGTVLSVNYDVWGTTITYIGYFLLFLGIILNITFSKFFKRIGSKKVLALFLPLFLFLGSTVKAENFDNLAKTAVSKQHANKFGELLIQDNNNRTKPVYTFASDLARKLYRNEYIYGLSPTQVFMEMHLDPKQWCNIPIIRITNKKLLQIVKSESKILSYNQLVVPNGQYVLKDLVAMAYAKSASERSKFDKAVLKADERVNICYSIFSGGFLKIYPKVKKANDSHWITLEDINKQAYVNPIFGRNNLLKKYLYNVQLAKENGSYANADKFLSDLKKYQYDNANYKLPTQTRIKAELIYYKWNVFKKLFPFYASIGILFLIALIIAVIRNKKTSKIVSYIFYTLLTCGFVVHTFGLALRWYISGHAPVSNGYEAMLFISWVTVLSGFVFIRKSDITVSATSVLAGMTLMVANLSFMDPVITNLVPVLQSYWLTLHVSVITGSYAFLGLGAILGIVNQILFALQMRKRKSHIITAIKQLTEVNNKTLVLGLSFLTIGTFLGAIWANESWGRYWGWDPKETWSLITIIVYTFVTHLHKIPNLKGTLIFNLLSLYAISSVLMTYFGVNYYLSGLHSYAGGDPVPIPNFLYYAVATLFTLSVLAWLGMKNVMKQTQSKIDVRL